MKAEESVIALLPVTRIAELAGFGDPAYFSREFKKAVGVAPSEYTMKQS